MKIKFITGGIDMPGVQTNVNPSYFYLKFYYTLYGKYPERVIWQKPSLIMHLTQKEELENILSDPPDILALSMFSWNSQRHFGLARDFKNKFPDRKVVIGGPHLTAHREPGFYEKYPYIDYVVYGDGEKAFKQIIDSIIEGDDTQITNNTVMRRNGETVVLPFEMVRDEEYMNKSAFVEQREHVTEIINDVISTLNIPRSQLWLIPEYSRGCMYDCTFCDWNQNLTKKVTRRQHDWRTEIDFFKELDVSIRSSDANFGQYKADIELYDYALSLYDPKKSFKFCPRSVAKLRKKQAYYVITKNAQVYKSEAVISLQDLDAQVLINIKRPEIPWEEHKEYIKQLKTDMPADVGIMAELIVGLPGQTVKSMVATLKELKSIGFTNFGLHIWMMTPNSYVGINEFYRKLHKIKTFRAFMPATFAGPIHTTKTLDEIYEMCANGENDPQEYTETEVCYSSATMTLKDVLQVDQIYRLAVRFPDQEFDEKSKLPLAKVERFLTQHQSYYEKYGFYVFGTLYRNIMESMGH